ncbi:MAG: FeoB-associated Cys-rich membrane protein [Clostridia bacterium]|nr:FeoB-associated Cys-rich membrane protein [Clostridia bacterium]
MNLGTIIVGIAVLALLVAIARKLLRDRKQGKNSCGCNCAHCPSAGMCHSAAKSR